MGLIVGLDLLLQRPTLLTLAKRLAGQGFGQLLALLGVGPCLLRQLRAISPCLHLPGQRCNQQ